MPMPSRQVTFRTNDVTGSGNGGLSFALNDNGDWYAIGFISPETFTLAKLVLLFLSKTGTPVAYDVRIETDNGTGRPSGTLAWANATTQVAANQAAGETAQLTLTASGTITVNTIYHVVIKPNTDPANTNYLTIQHSSAESVCTFNGWTATSTNSGVAWSNGNGPNPYIVLVSDTGAFYGHVHAPFSAGTLSNTVWIGAKLTAPVNMVVFAAVAQKLNSSAAGHVKARLIDSENTILAIGGIPAGFFDVMGGRQGDIYYFDTPAKIIKGRVYRVVWQDPNASQRFDYSGNYFSSTYNSLMPGGGNYVYTSGTSSDGTASPTSWTDTPSQEFNQFELVGSSADPIPTARNIRIGGGV